MFFQTLLFIFLIYLFVKIFFPSSKKSSRPKNSRFRSTPPPPFSKVRPEKKPEEKIVDEMKRCPVCGTYNPKTFARVHRGEYFCDESCVFQWKET